MSLFKKLDEILTKVGEVIDGIEDLKKRMDKVERRLYDHILEEKEQKLLGPDVYPGGVVTTPDTDTFGTPIAPESPSVVLYGVTTVDTTGRGWTNTSEIFIEDEP